MFEDRANELLQVLLDVGAKKIEIRMSGRNQGDFSLKGAVPYGDVSVTADGGARSNRSGTLTAKIEAPGRSVSIFDEAATPLHWYPHEASWQALVERRLRSGVTHDKFELTDSDVYGVDAKLAIAVKKNKLSLGGSFNASQSTSWMWTVDYPPASTA